MLKRSLALFVSTCVMYTGICANTGIDASTAICRYNLIHGEKDVILTQGSEKIGCTWQNGQIHDKALINSFYKMLKKQEGAFTVLDIGAQTGSFSLMSKFFPQSKWYAFEPITEVVTELKKNLTLNEIGNVQVYSVGLNSFTGKTTLSLPDKSAWGLATIGKTPLRFQTVETRTIDCITLDDFVNKHQVEKIDFIKIDTEGAEYFILIGGKNTIKKDRPIILMEFNYQNMQQCGVGAPDVNKLLESMAYISVRASADDVWAIPKERFATFSVD